MSIVNISFAPKITFQPGGRFLAKSQYNRRQHEGLEPVRQADGAIYFYLDDNRRRYRFPKTSIAWVLENEEPDPVVEVPQVEWQLTSAVFRGEVHVGGNRTSIDYWSADNHPDIGCVETANGVRLSLPDNRFANVPWHSITSLTDRAIAASRAAPKNDWPETEVTPAQPPRRPAPPKRT